MKLYIVTNNVNGKQYVGITVGSIVRRWVQHLSDAKRGSRHLFHRAIRKHGSHAFDIEEVASTDTYEQLRELEVCFIDALGTRSPAGYNSTNGGDGSLGRIWTNEAKAKIATSLRGRPGYPRTPEIRARNSAATIGFRHSAASRAKMSEDRKGVPGHEQTAGTRARISSKLKGRVFSQETRNKMSQSAKRRHDRS